MQNSANEVLFKRVLGYVWTNSEISMILFTFTEKIFLGKLYFLTLLEILFSDFFKKDLFNEKCCWCTNHFYTFWKVSKYGAYSDLYFPVFGLNTEKYGPEQTSYWATTFHIVSYLKSIWWRPILVLLTFYLSFPYNFNYL